MHYSAKENVFIVKNNFLTEKIQVCVMKYKVKPQLPRDHIN